MTDLTVQDYRRLVAGTLARYWAPLLPAESVHDDCVIDELDYGQADHVLAELLAAGVTLPGLPPDTFTDLVPERRAGQHEHQHDPGADDPLLSVAILLPRSMIDRVKALATASETWQAVMRRLVFEGIEAARRT